MKIGGIQPFSLSDYPGCVSAILFTQGCNFRCPFCHNPSLVLPELFQSPIPQEEIMQFLHLRMDKLDGVVITGGEPTIHSDLVVFIEQIKEMGYKVKLDTNGSNPQVVEELLQRNLIDYCALDIKAPWSKYSLLIGVSISVEPIQKTLKILLESGIPCDFRITNVKALLSEDDLKEVEAYLPKTHPLIVQKFVAENAMNPLLSDFSNL